MLTMNRSKKRLISFSLFLVMLLLFFRPFYVKAFDNTDNLFSKNITDKIPNDAVRYIKENYIDVIDIIKTNIDKFNIDENTIYNLKLGKPFVIYDFTEEKQDEIYYFPLLNDKNVILVISVMGTTVGWNISASEDMVSYLNIIDYASDNYIFYGTDNRIVCESLDEIIYLSGKDNHSYNNFETIDFKEKINIISKRIDNFIKTDTSKVILDAPNTEKSTLTLYNPKGQGTLQICWAATVATITNYINRSNYTALDVCDMMGVYEGTFWSVSQLALQNYGIAYEYRFRQLTLSEVKNNLNDGWPIYETAGDGNNNWHAVTVYNHSMPSTTDYISIWNPGINGGSGGTQVITYNPNGCTFTYNNKTWTWSDTLSFE